MVDVNIVADKERAELLVLECQRLGLSCKLSDTPISGARIYIAYTDLCGDGKLSPQNTVAIGKSSMPYTLDEEFLLSDLRRMLFEMLSSSKNTEKKQPVKARARGLGIMLDQEKRSVTVRGREVVLSPTEFAVFKALFDKRGEVVSHREIDALIGADGSNKSNVYICFLRKKLESGGDKIIYSVRGKGFMLR